MDSPASPAAATDPATWERARLDFRRELLSIEPDLLALLDKATAGDGLVDLNDWERSILGLVLCFTTAALMLPERPYPTLQPSKN